LCESAYTNTDDQRLLRLRQRGANGKPLSVVPDAKLFSLPPKLAPGVPGEWNRHYGSNGKPCQVQHRADDRSVVVEYELREHDCNHEQKSSTERLAPMAQVADSKERP
jgi:hypothetical protein